MQLMRSRPALSETSSRAPLKVESVRGRRSLPESRVVVELNAGEEGGSDDRRHCPIDNKAKRRPPASVSDELVAVLPQILEPVAGEPCDEQPRGDSHANCSDHHERSGDRTLGYEDVWTAIGNGEADVHRSDGDQTERVDDRSVKPPERQRRCRLRYANDEAPYDRRSQANPHG